MDVNVLSNTVSTDCNLLWWDLAGSIFYTRVEDF